MMRTLKAAIFLMMVSCTLTAAWAEADKSVDKSPSDTSLRDQYILQLEKQGNSLLRPYGNVDGMPYRLQNTRDSKQDLIDFAESEYAAGRLAHALELYVQVAFVKPKFSPAIEELFPYFDTAGQQMVPMIVFDRIKELSTKPLLSDSPAAFPSAAGALEILLEAGKINLATNVAATMLKQLKISKLQLEDETRLDDLVEALTHAGLYDFARSFYDAKLTLLARDQAASLSLEQKRYQEFLEKYSAQLTRP